MIRVGRRIRETLPTTRATLWPFLMPPYHPEPPGVGTKLVRLRDVPPRQRMKALRLLLRSAKDEKEAMRLLAIAVNPEDKGGRIAA